MKENVREHLLSIVLYGASGLALLLLFYMAVDSSVWVDEAYTMGIIKYSIPDIIRVTAQDVHPPLYYILVKIVFLFLGTADLYTAVIAARMVSLIPYLIMWVLSLTYIRKNFNELTGALFSLCLMTAPQMIATALEIRMYSWSMLFLLTAFLAVCRLILSEKKKMPAYIVLGTAVLCAFYIHYFAAVGAAFLLFLYFLFVLLYERKQILPFLVLCAADALLYLPWLIIAYGQIRSVQQDYWIPPIDEEALQKFFWYVFRIDEGTFGIAAGVVLAAAALSVFAASVYKRKEKQCMLATGAMALILFIALAGVAASRLLRPVFVERYMIPGLACFWLGFSYLLSRLHKKKYLFIAISLFLFGLGGKQYAMSIETVLENREAMESVEDLFSSIDGEDVILHSSLNTEVPAAYYCQNSFHYMMEKPTTQKIDQIVFDNVKDVLNPEDIEPLLEEKKTVWCFAYPNAEVLSDEWGKMLENSQYIGEYALDWCIFSVYRWN